MADEKIEIVEFSPHWFEMFEAEKALLQSVISPWLHGSIEHVGSTSVEGLAAKPIIDIMVGVKSLDASQPAIKELEQLGYCYYPYKADVMHWFCKPTPEVRTHHLHLIPFQSPLWKERIQFRDSLRNNPDIAKAYQALKFKLAEAHHEDRERYTREKWTFIKEVLRKYT